MKINECVRPEWKDYLKWSPIKMATSNAFVVRYMLNSSLTFSYCMESNEFIKVNFFYSRRRLFIFLYLFYCTWLTFSEEIPFFLKLLCEICIMYKKCYIILYKKTFNG